MMSTLKEKIQNERGFFDTHEPKPGHRERFIDMLESEPLLKRKRNIAGLWMKIAASLVILISVSYITFNFISEKKSNAQNVLLIEYNEDFESILSFYDQKASNKLSELEKFSKSSEQATEMKSAVMKQFEELDISLAAIEKDYLKNPDNEKLKAAMINNKRNKVKVMDQVIRQLNMANHQLF